MTDTAILTEKLPFTDAIFSPLSHMMEIQCAFPIQKKDRRQNTKYISLVNKLMDVFVIKSYSTLYGHGLCNRLQMHTLLIHVMSQISPINNLTLYFREIMCSVFRPYTSMFHKLYLPLFFFK
jgi:hypothetical protein